MGSPIDVGGQYPFITFFTPPRLSGKFPLWCDEGVLPPNIDGTMPLTPVHLLQREPPIPTISTTSMMKLSSRIPQRMPTMPLFPPLHLLMTLTLPAAVTISLPLTQRPTDVANVIANPIATSLMSGCGPAQPIFPVAPLIPSKKYCGNN